MRPGALGVFAAVPAFHRANRLGGARQRAFGEIGGVCIADRFVLDRAQAEALRSVIGRLLEAAIVEHEYLGLAIFQEQFAVVGAVQPARNRRADFAAVEPGPVDQRGNGWIHRFILRGGAPWASDKASMAIWRGTIIKRTSAAAGPAAYGRFGSTEFHGACQTAPWKLDICGGLVLFLSASGSELRGAVIC